MSAHCYQTATSEWFYAHSVYRLSGRFLVAQSVAVKWSPLQKIIWPTKGDPFKRQQFTTEANCLRKSPVDRIGAKKVRVGYN